VARSVGGHDEPGAPTRPGPGRNRQRPPVAPIDRIEPLEPIDRIEPDDPIDRIEPAERTDRSDPTEPALNAEKADAAER